MGLTARSLVLAMASAVVATSAHAQLRPYEPAPWDALLGSSPIHASLGARYLRDQPATLAGVEGDLFEAGLVQASFRAGPVVIRALGVPWRHLSVDAVTGTPAPGTGDPGDQSIAGVGDFSVETVVAPIRWSGGTAMLRFGTRLPTTDNRIGLERDRTDFHALIGARHRAGSLAVTGEVGVGIHGTREMDYEQSDVLVYIAGVEWDGPALLGVDLVGHADGLAGRSIRGNEELAEVRLYAQTGGRFQLRLEGIAGLTESSPGHGLGVRIGSALP